jgi:NAD(P)-dependent dehydrogenase (short-subunit alcohol dehydrogenase family)
MGDTEAIPEPDARLQMETLFWGPVFMTQEAVRIFREINPSLQGGTVVQISSIGGLVTFPGSAFYHAR